MEPWKPRPNALERILHFGSGFVFFGVVGLCCYGELPAFLICGAIGGVLALFWGDRFWISTTNIWRHWWRL